MNKTAVTWLINEIRKKYILNQDDIDLFEQAKKIEKQQIIDAWENGAYGGGQFTSTFDSAEQYYKETFKQNN